MRSVGVLTLGCKVNTYESAVMRDMMLNAGYIEANSDEIADSKFVNRIIEMNEAFGIPKTFDFIKDDDIAEMAKNASKEANPLYPVPVLMSAKELEKLYYKIKA